jgi:hypothetical protein
MSTLPDNEFDLEKLFLPAWAQEEPSATKYAKYEGETDRPERRGDRRGPRPPRRDGAPRPRREGGPRSERRGPSRIEDQAGQPVGVERGGRLERGDRTGRGPRPGFRRGGDRPERREPPAPLPEISASLIPEERGVESLARQIKMTGRAYPLFDIAQMILQKPERLTVSFSIKKNPEGQPVQPLFACALDDSLWLSEDEAVAHVLRKHFATFYQAEKTATEPPKGKYTFVAQCGMSGIVLGPPNHHDYQNQLRKLHSERFSRMPFEVYKARVKIVRDEEVVKKWVDDQSWKTEYLCLNMPEPLRLTSMEAVEKHFRENHKDNIIKAVDSYRLNGAAARNLRCHQLTRLVRSVWDDQRRFPLQIATVLSQQFASHGLQFFKVNKTFTHVSVARPHYLDVAVTPVSEGVKRIVDLINAIPKCTRRQLVEALTPTPAAPVVPVTPAAPEETQAAPAEGQPAAPAEPAGPTPEQTAVISDLHWLIHQGHVIEFANGTLETAKKPLPRPPKPERKPEEKPAEGNATTEAAAAGEAAASTPAAEITQSPPEGTAPAEAPAPIEATESAPVVETAAASEPPAGAPSGEVAPSNGSSSTLPEPAGTEAPTEPAAAPAQSSS